MEHTLFNATLTFAAVFFTGLWIFKDLFFKKDGLGIQEQVNRRGIFLLVIMLGIIASTAMGLVTYYKVVL